MIRQFLAPDTPLMTFSLGGEVVGATRTPDDPESGRLLGKPLYVLTSAATVSAGEEFVGHVAGYRIGEVVGERTAGGAFNNAFFPIAGGYVLSVSIGRPILAATGGDWEGVGFEPTVPADILSARDVAHAHALDRLAGTAPPDRAATLTALARTVRAMDAHSGSALSPETYVGRFGTRTTSINEGRLYLRDGLKAPLRLMPLGEHRFAVEDAPDTLFEFVIDEARASALLVQSATGETLTRVDRTADD